MSFQIEYDYLDPSDSQGPSVAVLPWDSKTFGFNVGEVKIGFSSPMPTLASQFAAWTKMQNLRLVSAAIPAHRIEWLESLQRMGFRVIDTIVTMGFNDLQRAKVRPCPMTIREATQEDLKKLKEIAAIGFKVGRYHADLQFPRPLANQRYVQWVENSLNQLSANTLVLVADCDGEPVGFTISVLRGEEATCQLTCVHPRFQNNIIGFSLAAGQTHTLKSRGIQRTRSRLSVQSVALIQMNEYLGNSILGSDYILHWHSPELQ